MTARNVAVIFGGRSTEHEVSAVSARSVMAALDTSLWKVAPFAISRNGHWLGLAETDSLLASGAVAFEKASGPPIPDSVLAELASCNVAFPLVHGTYGEDGTLQGLLEILALPYAGAGVAASAIGMDKALMKALFREAGVPVGPFCVLRRWDVERGGEDTIRFVEEEAGYPCFVKPANGGSSVGVSKVSSREDLAAAFTAAFSCDDKILVETAVEGREVECSVLGNETPRASIVGEIEPDREFYDYDSKYAEESTSALYVPARLDDETTACVQDLALRMYDAMGCEGYARVDFFVTAENEVIANEVNTIPGFTSISMFPKLWEASGLGYSQLLTEILELGLRRAERRRRR
jgi:D-alanine-D-alanine ligase